MRRRKKKEQVWFFCPACNKEWTIKEAIGFAQIKYGSNSYTEYRDFLSIDQPEYKLCPNDKDWKMIEIIEAILSSGTKIDVK